MVDDTDISPAVHNGTMDEIAAGLSGCITRDGQSTISANIPFNNKGITSLLAGSTPTGAANIQNLMHNSGRYCATVGGTADAITLTPAIAAPSYTVGQELYFIASSDNTGAVTVNVSGLGAKDVMKMGAVALVAGEIVSGAMANIIYDGTRFLLLSPAVHEGTWTLSVGGTATYTSRVGRWTKIGKAVHIQGTMVINAIGTGSTSVISGLPYTSLNNGINSPLAVADFAALATNVVWIGAYVNANAATVTLRNLTAAGSSATSSALLGNSASVTFGGVYYI